MKKILSRLTVLFFLTLLTVPGINAKGTSDRSHSNNDKVPGDELFTLTVTCNTGSLLKPGDDLLYNIYLMNLLGPVANVQVKINDPLDRICTFVTTGPDGRCIWLKQIPRNARPAIYIIEFFYENAKQYSKIAISSGTASVVLPSYPVNLKITNTLDPQTLLLANKGGFTNNTPDIKSLLKEAAKFGLAVAKDYLSNPGHVLTVITAVASCSAGLAPLCFAATQDIVSDLTLGAAKEIGNRIIDAGYQNPQDRAYYKKLLSLSTTAMSVISINPADGILSDINVLSGEYEFLNDVSDLPLLFGNKIKGASFAAQRKGKNEIVVFSMYDRGKDVGTVTQPSKDPKCKENSTGDFSFQNNSGLDLRVTFYSSPSKSSPYSTPVLSCTLQPGQQQSFFNVPAGAARYKIYNETLGSSSPNGNKFYNAEGSLYVDACQKNSFLINVQTPSYATNAHSDFTANPASKDSLGCVEKQTGDFCFQNDTKFDLRVTLYSSPSKSSPYSTPVLDCTIQPGQRQYFFNVPAGPARYKIYNETTSSFSANGNLSYSADGQLYVDACQINLFIIK